MTPLSFRENAWMQSIRLNPHTDSVWCRTAKGTILSISPGIKVPDDPEASLARRRFAVTFGREKNMDNRKN